MRKSELLKICAHDEQVLLLSQWLANSDLPFVTHPLGFIQSKWEEEGFMYRLNIWARALAKPKEPDWRIHNHSFSFRSFIIFGELRDERYEIGEGDLYREYQVAYDSSVGSSILVRTERVVSLQHKQSSAFKSGDSYAIGSNELHSTESNCDMSVSLMEIRSASSSSPLVYGDVEPAAELQSYTSEAVSLADIIAEMKTYRPLPARNRSQ